MVEDFFAGSAAEDGRVHLIHVKAIFPFAAILLAGLSTALEGATNGWMTKASGSLFFAMAVVFATTAGLSLLALPFGATRPHWSEVRQLPWYAWAGGIYTLVTITLAAWATPKLGAGPALVAALLAQTASGLGLDHFAALGLEHHPIAWLKAAGLMVMLAGAGMIAIKSS